MQFVVSQGWTWTEDDSTNIRLNQCPYCKASTPGHGPFRMEIRGANDIDCKRDGLHICHRCGKSGRLYDIKQALGIAIAGVDSRKDWSGSAATFDSLPDIDACHQALLEDEDALDYLVNGRGFSRNIIMQQKIGLIPRHYFRETGEVRALVYPYLVNGNCIFVHYRTLPTMPLSSNKVPKAFSSPKGWDAPLYNGGILVPGLKRLFLVEGEADAIAALDHGVTEIAGVPGADFKKAEWIDTLDKLDLERIYICYDKDKAGQKGAQALAARVGIERCWKIILPEFEVVAEDGSTRKGKDINEWFVSGGGTAERFERLIADATLFDVDGVSSSHDATQEFLEELLGKQTLEPTYKTPWPSLNKLLGFEDGDVIDILAAEKIGKTTIGMNLMEHVVNEYGEDGIIICLEMMRARMARKWVAHVAQIKDSIPRTPEEASALLQAFKDSIPAVQAMAANRPGDLFFCYPKYKTAEDIYSLIRDCIRRYGVKWIMIDNLQLLCDTTLSGSKNRTQHLSEISKALVKINKEFGTKMIRILQPHRVGDGKMVTTDNVDGASQIAKDCDCMLTAHRNRIGVLSADQFETCLYVEQDASFDDKMLIGVGLSRYSAGGYTTLLFDGPTSTVTEFNPAQIAKLQAEVNQNVGHDKQLQALGILKAAVVPGTVPSTGIGAITI